jgi:hypothetical protein
MRRSSRRIASSRRALNGCTRPPTIRYAPGTVSLPSFEPGHRVADQDGHHRLVAGLPVDQHDQVGGDVRGGVGDAEVRRLVEAEFE